MLVLNRADATAEEADNKADIKNNCIYSLCCILYIHVVVVERETRRGGKLRPGVSHTQNRIHIIISTKTRGSAVTGE